MRECLCIHLGQAGVQTGKLVPDTLLPLFFEMKETQFSAWDNLFFFEKKNLNLSASIFYTYLHIIYSSI